MTDQRSICDCLENNALALGDKTAIRYVDEYKAN